MGDSAKFSTGSEYFDYALIVPALWNLSMDAMQAISDIPDAFEGPEIPDAPTPDAPTVAGDEGIRRGEMQRMSKKRELGALYLTRGQDRQPTLGGMRQSLG